MLIIGIPGKTLTSNDRDCLARPEVSGVILFARNFESRMQVAELIEAVRACRPDPFLICVDQEGGPVQRFRDGFTRLPALARIGEIYARDHALAVALAEEHAWLMASEMRAIGVDISFAPVADLARGNRAIGERAFHADPAVVSELLLAYLRGMRIAGMAATLKHFPGHGSVAEDTHFDVAVDPRPLEELLQTDLVPFADAIDAGAEAVMLAHVTYPAVDALAAGFSPTWIAGVLRGRLGFRGLAIGDDIGMAAVEGVGGIAARIDAHRRAGCDLILACNPSIVPESLAAVEGLGACPADRLATLCGAAPQAWDALVDNPQRDTFIARVTALDATARA
ncbi:MAG TPA: beta-N-acetylhexosaminidase [Dokdonella sp.]|uniref:beta-N-acetylhexosaminidase n=1 Tax=Dokdonella sp. TaxID=2291710 RepID=UPI002C4CB1F6|nr:beta-N-acetylhexosaminidase [Dokdonella sp.]HUD43255.1 beta-N-acetylhexosaminidase [Dokdonella sp.]